MRLVKLFPLFASAFNGGYQVVGSVDDADCVLAQAMGYGMDDGEPVPGRGNEELASYIHRNCGSLPVFAQAEIAVALSKLGYPGQIIVVGEMGVRISAFDVLAEEIAEIWERDLTRPMVVTSRHLVGRVTALLRKHSIDPIIPQHLPQAFDPDSAQIRTRGLVGWTAWEILVWPHHRLKGWI